MTSVAQLFAERLAAGSEPGHRADPHKLVLCIEGGGMRGPAPGGMVEEIHNVGATLAFDAIYGTSAGAMVGAYLLSGNPQEGNALYWQHLSGRRFVQMWQVPRGRGLNLDYLFDTVICQRVTMNWARLLGCGVPLIPLLSDPRSRQAMGADQVMELETRDQMLAALRAAVRVPLACGNPWREPEAWWDAAPYEPVPCSTPLSDGATHLLVLRSVPHQADPLAYSQQSRLNRSLNVLYQRGQTLIGALEYDQALLPLERTSAEVDQIHPLYPLPLSNVCTDPELLQTYALAGRTAAARWIRSACATAVPLP